MPKSLQRGVCKLGGEAMWVVIAAVCNTDDMGLGLGLEFQEGGLRGAGVETQGGDKIGVGD